jgi:serine/threonine protein phosphatase 1
MFIGFLEDPAEIGRHWFRNGGWETVTSYGVSCSPNLTAASEFRQVRDDLLARMPPDHLLLLRALSLTASFGDYFFVHGGARPGVALADTSEEDALWIRHGFSDRDEPFEKVVVHGHSPSETVFVGRHRINLDTGAYATGRLSCVVLEGRDRRFIEVTG